MIHPSGKNIVSHFHEAAIKYPHRFAIIDKKGQITFGEMRTRVCAAAAQMRQKGIKPGDRVLVFVPMSIDLYVQVLALFHVGATAVFLDEWVNLKRLKRCCEIAQCRAFIGIPLVRFIGFFVRSIRAIPIHIASDTSMLPTVQLDAPLTIDQVSETALITFTTGSTGTPKAAKRTHDFLQVQFEALTDKIQPREDDVDMPVLPIVLMINLGQGIPSIIANWKSSKPQNVDEDAIWKQVQIHGVNRITSSPYFLQRLAQRAVDKGWDTSVIRKIFTGGAPVYPDEAGLIQRAFASSSFEIVFGSTEAEPISAIDARELQAQTNLVGDGGLLVGKPHPWSEVRIIRWQDQPIAAHSDADIEAMQCGTHEVGEIIVRGRHVLREYINNEEALLRNKIFYQDVCWHRTGDSGFFNERGELFLTGRAANLFKLGDVLVSPFVVEYRLKQLPGVRAGTVIKHHDKLVYFIESNLNVPYQALELEIRSWYQAPHQFVWSQSFPRDKRHYSKIEYGELKKKLGIA